MNFLAHIYLSGDSELISIGNFIADGIRGKQYQNFPVEIQKGILLHRQIDSFTDSHPIVRKSTKRLHPYYSHYSSVIIDIYYDHFLAKNWKTYSDIPLADYANDFYDTLTANYDILPEKTHNLMPYMLADNWLLNYAKIDGIEQVLSGMNKRTKNASGMDKAAVELLKYYDEFETEFTAFFEELIPFSKLKLKEIQILFK